MLPSAITCNGRDGVRERGEVLVSEISERERIREREQEGERARGRESKREREQEGEREGGRERGGERETSPCPALARTRTR